MIYIFTKDGELFIESGVSFDTYGNYFALVPYTIKINEDDSNDYSFIVGYLKKKTYAYNSSDLIINLFVFNNFSRNITKGNDISLSIGGKLTFWCDNGFSCQLMSSEKNGTVLACFFDIENELVTIKLEIIIQI